MVKKIHLLLFLILFGSSSVFGADSLSYSGRLVNSDGSPVVGPVKLKFDLAYTDDLSNILCTHQLPSADLINGVFHAKLSFTCPDTTLVKVLENVPLNNSIAIRVTNESPATPKVYSFQSLNSVPYSIMANFAKQLSLAGTATGQVLTWNGSAWTAADPVGTPGGVTTISAEQGLSGVKVDETVTIGILDGGVTAQKLHPMGAMTAGQVLKWNGSNWEAGADTDTGITSEMDPNVRTFARTDITGLVPETCSPHQALHYILMNDSLECVDIRAASVADAINDAETAKAPSQNAVFDALAGKQSTLTSSSDVTLKYLKLMTDGAFWVGLKAPISTSGNIFFTLPSADGTTGQVLKTDGSGNLGWVNAANGTLTGITTSAPLSGTGTSGSVALSMNYDDSTIGLNGSNALIVKDSGISNNHIAALANIDWAKINKTGAVAADVGAVPTGRLVSAGTGLLGGGNLSADRTLSVDVGTTVGKIVQLETGGKLPAVDGSQLTNLGTNLGKWSDATGGIHYSSGNVGINTTTPGTINGWTPSTSMRILEITGDNSNSANADGILLLSNNRPIPTANDQLGAVIFGSKNDTGGIHAAITSNLTGVGGVNGFGTNLALHTKDDNVAGSTVRLIVNSKGDVGIGTNNPVSTLDVNGTIKMKQHSSAPQTCNTVIDGTMAMTSVYSLCVCRSSIGWVSMTDGSLDCPWTGYPIVTAGSGRTWSDGTYAKSCNEYKNPRGLYRYAGVTGTGVYTIDPDGAGAITPFNVTCDMTTDGGGWTAITPAIAKNNLGAGIIELDPCTVSWDGDLPRTRDGTGDCSTHYDIPFPASFTKFYLSNYQVKAYAVDTSDMGSTSPITTWNSRWGGMDDGLPTDSDVGWGSATDSAAAVSWISAGGPSFSCTSCIQTFTSNDIIYSVSAPSQKFRIEWGEGGSEAEGWYPWYSGVIYLR